MDDFAADLRALLLHVFPRIGGADLLGVSMGGMIVQQFARRYPTLVRSLIVGCSNGGRAHAVLAEQNFLAVFAEADANASAAGMNVEQRRRALAAAMLAFNFPEAWRTANAAHYAQLIDDGLRYRRPAAGVIAQFSATAHFDMGAALRDVSAPVLLLHGALDDMIPVRNAEILAKQMPHAAFVRMADAGHQFWISHEADAVKSVVEFLRTVESRHATARAAKSPKGASAAAGAGASAAAAGEAPSKL
jgi:pimeloyl-ACP methyl ester carboxylesterase